MNKDRQKYLIRLLDSYCLPMKRALTGFITIITVATIVQVWSIAKLVSALLLDIANFSSYWYYFPIIVVTFIVKALAIYYRSQLTQRAAANIRSEIRKQIVMRCNTLGAKGLGHNTTSMSIFYLEQVDLLNNYIARFFPQALASRMQPVMILVAVFALNWVAGLVLLITFPLLPVFMILIGIKTSEMNARQLQSLLYLGNQFHDKLIGIKTLISFSQQENVLAKMTRNSQNYTKTTVDLLKVAFLNSAVLEFLSSISVALMALYFGLSYINHVEIGSYTGTAVSLFAGYFSLTLAGEFFMPLRDLGTFYHDRSSALNAMDELDKFINQQAIENNDYIDIDQVKAQALANQETVEKDDLYDSSFKTIDLTTNPNPNTSSLANQNPAVARHQVNNPIIADELRDANADYDALDTEYLDQTIASADQNKVMPASDAGDVANIVASNQQVAARAQAALDTNATIRQDTKKAVATAATTHQPTRKPKSTKRKSRIKLAPIFLDATKAPYLPQLKYAFSKADDNSLLELTPTAQVVVQDLAVFTHSGKKLLSGISFSFSLQEKIAIVGLSGAGKTTLLSALLGLYPYTGSISYNGVELTNIDKTQFYSYFSWLGQNPNLDQTSILENLQYVGRYLANQLDAPAIAMPNLSNKRDLTFQQQLLASQHLSHYSMQQAIALAKIDDLVASKGLAYQIQQHNIGLSGGQVQRIALARALAKPHLFLIIDEPTANLDHKLEQAVFDNIKHHAQGVLMVTHRLNHSQAFDKVYQLSRDGLVLSQGGQ